LVPAAQFDAPIVHPDMAQPHLDSLGFKCPIPMARAIKARALATGVSYGWLARELIRRGAATLDPPLDVIGGGLPPAEGAS
jgi:hypothetical protein